MTRVKVWKGMNMFLTPVFPNSTHHTTKVQLKPAQHAKQQLDVVPAGVGPGESTVHTDSKPGSNDKVDQVSKVTTEQVSQQVQVTGRATDPNNGEEIQELV